MHITHYVASNFRSFLEVADPSLRKIREVIMKLSSDHSCNGNVNDFPPHTCEVCMICSKSEILCLTVFFQNNPKT